jgi:hypothetical protein
MIVCPVCRTANDEGAQVCASCGRSLEPAASYLMPVRRAPGARSHIEDVPPTGPSRWRAFIVLGAVVLVAVGAGTWMLFRPDPCRGTNFSSENFGYCLTVPEGWTAEPARFGSSVELDQFAVPSQGATVIVEAVDLELGADLGGFADFVRQKDKTAGLKPGPGTITEIDGVTAQVWDITVASDSGTTYQLREVVVVKDQVGWRITLNDLADNFDDHAVLFQAMLRSWRFR